MINDVTGFILHSILLVPYFSWKISHRRHHANTGCIVSADEQMMKKRMVEEEDHDNYFNQIKVHTHTLTCMHINNHHHHHSSSLHVFRSVPGLRVAHHEHHPHANIRMGSLPTHKYNI
jgi:hypothetical protein